MSESTRPTPPPFPNGNHIPSELLSQPRFTGWKKVWDESKQKDRKPPHSAVTAEGVGPVEKNAEHFLPFEEAVAGAKRHNLDGIGLVLFKDDGLVFIDIDDGIKDGVTDPEVKNWLQWFPNTWIHESPSGTGYHIIGRGKISKALQATPLSKTSAATVEIYSWDRYATLTGKLLPGTLPVIGDLQLGVDKLLAHLQVDKPSVPSSASESARSTTSAGIRQYYETKLAELRNNPVKSGDGNGTLNSTALIAARVFACGVFEKTEEQFKRELLDIVTKDWTSPHPEDAARKTIISGWTKGISEGPYNLIEIMKAEELKLPDMPSSVLCGKLGEICRARLSDFPIAYSWLSILAAASALVKPHPVRRCNINVCLVGPVHYGKTQAQERANFLFRLADQGLVEEVKSGSAEGLLEKIGDRGGSPVLWFPDELSHVLEKAQIQNASFPSVLNSLFYKDSNALTVQRRKQVKFNARLSIAGGVVEENFGNSFGAATTAGLYDRFLFGLFPTGSFEYSYRPMQGPPLFNLSQVPRETLFDPQTMSLGPRVESPEIDSSVFDARDAIRKEEKIEPRLLELCIRTALICAAWDGKSELRASDLEPAWELARYQQRVRLVLQPNPGRNFDGIVAHKIMNYLKLHTDGEKWLGWREVYRATHVMDFGSSVAERSMNALVFAGEIERTTIRPPKGGKETVLIRLARE
jgi:hypothetical protein